MIPTPPQSPDAVKVMQEDREAAALLVAWFNPVLSDPGFRCRNGELDDHFVVQTLARHRLSSSPSGIGADELLDEIWQELRDKDDRDSLEEPLEMVLISQAELGQALQLAALCSQSRMGEGWQDIATAPNGSAAIWVGRVGPYGLWGMEPVRARSHCEWQNIYTGKMIDWVPTHWQPLPAPPSLTPKEQ